ncbi:MAG TPA: ATP-binding cassette domain-containing protein, partial [Ignavibacteriaceae bacterium]
LVKIIAGIIGASKGKIVHKLSDKEISEEHLHDHIGFVSPYLVLYEEFSTYENLILFSDIRGISFNKERVDYLLNKFLLYKRKDDLLKTYSSGMKQRVKFIFALMHSPELLILDEPTSNLDDEGKNSVYELVKEEAQKNIVLIASNEKHDLELCGEIVYLEKYKN